jgi:outer membrane protein
MKLHAALLAALAASVGSAAHAQEAGDWIWRAGVHTVQPKSNNHDVVNVDSAAMLTFSGTYFFARNWGVEVLGALPFEHDIDLNGGGGKVAETKQLPPTVSLQYHFNPGGVVRPYLGAGINYTLFFSEDTTGALDGSKLKLDGSSVRPCRWAWTSTSQPTGSSTSMRVGSTSIRMLN